MNATHLLIRDHTKFKKLFTQFESAGDKALKRKQTIAAKAIEEIMRHSRAEEAIFYPALQQLGGKELQDKILEGIEEHRVADYVMQRIQQTPIENDSYSAKFKVLAESVKHHIQEEEKKVFPKAKKVLGVDEKRLGQELQAFKEGHARLA